MDYSNFAAMLPVKVTFSKHELQPLSSKRSINERVKEIIGERLHSNLSDIVDQKMEQLDPLIKKKLLNSELAEEGKYDPELIYDNVRVVAQNKDPKFRCKS